MMTHRSALRGTRCSETDQGSGRIPASW
jgi:hypothetical protein